MSFRDIWLCLCASRHGEAAAVSRRARGSQKKKKKVCRTRALIGARRGFWPFGCVRMAPPPRRSPVRAARKSGAARARVLSGVFVAAAGPPGRTPTNSTVSLSHKQSRRKKKDIKKRGRPSKRERLFYFYSGFLCGVSSRSSSLADELPPRCLRRRCWNLLGGDDSADGSEMPSNC